MNKNDIRTAAEAAVKVESFGLVTLGRFWDETALAGDFWRFYHHVGAGAGVTANGKTVDFISGVSYLIAPDSRCLTHCKGSPEQFFIHIEVKGCRFFLKNPVVRLPDDFQSSAIGFLRREISLGHFQHPKFRMKLLSLASEALSELPETSFRPSDEDPRIVLIQDYINTHLNEEMTLNSIAAQAELSAVTLLRLFRKECGITPYQYLLQQRYQLAARLLRHTRMSVEEICEAAGVDDRFHFSRFFKRLFGMPPAAYRKHYCVKR